jgi:ParB family chromosome partitioning protein
VSKRGLPGEHQMRHDSHFVDTLADRFTESVGRLIPIGEIEPNPEQPRRNVGDLRDLKASIEAKGILEPILVRPLDSGKFQIISGERRFRAAMEAGLEEIPCVELRVSDEEALEVALIENLQRKDLTAFEEAEGYEALSRKYGYTHERVSRAVGKSRVSVTEAFTILAIPEELREQCRRADIESKRVLLEIARAGSAAEMKRLIEIAGKGATRDSVRAARRMPEATSKEVRGKPFQFRYAPKDAPFRLNVSFGKSRVTREELEQALRQVLRQLEAGEVSMTNPARKKPVR